MKQAHSFLFSNSTYQLYNWDKRSEMVRYLVVERNLLWLKETWSTFFFVQNYNLFIFYLLSLVVDIRSVAVILFLIIQIMLKCSLSVFTVCEQLQQYIWEYDEDKFFKHNILKTKNWQRQRDIQKNNFFKSSLVVGKFPFSCSDCSYSVNKMNWLVWIEMIVWL